MEVSIYTTIHRTDKVNAVSIGFPIMNCIVAVTDIIPRHVYYERLYLNFA